MKAYGGAMVQAHPMRRGKNVLLDPKYLDGVEINSHPKYDCTHLDELSAFAHEHGLLITSGGDFHADTHRPHCGAILPDGNDNPGISRFICTTDSIELHYQEPEDRFWQSSTFCRTK